MKRLIFALLCALAVSATQAYAMDAEFDRDTKVVTISGVANANESLAVVVTDSNISKIENATKETIKAHGIGLYEVNADENGEYEVTFKATRRDANCNIFVSGEKTEDSATIEIFSEKTLEEAFATLVDAASKGEDDIKKALLDEDFRKAIGVNDLYNDLDDKGLLVSAIASVDEYTSFAQLTEAVATLSDVQSVCNEFNAMINKAQVKDIVKKMQAAYGGDEKIYDKYFDLKSTDSIDKVVFNKKPFASIEEAYEVFEDAVKDYKESSGGGSGGGGGGGGGGSVSLVTPVSSSPIPVVETKQSFADVKPDFWGFEAIEGLYEKGIVNGVSNDEFAPDRPIKREEFVKMLVALIGMESDGSSDTFADTDKSAWYSPYLAIAQKCGLAYGKDDGSFGIGEVLTRQDMAVLATRVLGTTERGTAVEFADAEEIASYATNSVEILCGMKIMSGVGEGRFAPKDTATRAQAARVIYEIAKIIG